MNYQLLNILKCPLTKKDLRFELISVFDRTYNDISVKEIKDGILYSDSGLIFPVIDGIPRIFIEAHIDYADWLSNNLKDFEIIKSEIQKNFPGLLKYCLKKNNKTKKSFALEWSLLDYEKQDKVWHDDEKGLENLFFNEADENASTLKGKRIIDTGCGHGLNARAIAKFCNTVIGAELGKSIENAYKNNTCENVWFIQADLQFLPFADKTFDILLSGGVLHHTPNTELALSNVETTLKSDGKLCIWLYQPQKSIIHNMFNNLRKLTSHLPVKFQYYTYLFFVFPLTYSIKKIKGRKINWREEMIDLMDTLSPIYRHEHFADEAGSWLQKRGYSNIKVTTTGQYGFSIIGVKK